MLEYKKIYIIGIEGAGTSALAGMYKNLGAKVLGSDEGDHFYADVLKNGGIEVFNSYDAKHITKDVDLVVYSTSIKEDNAELVMARKKEKRILSYSQAVAELFNKKVGIAVCGTHGKTTTTAMLATVLEHCGISPSAIVGSKVIDWNSNTLAGGGEYFVIEADEYQNKLQYYEPNSVILTSVDYDHPDFFKNFEEYKKAFSNFVEKVPVHGLLVYYNDSRDVVDVSKAATCKKVSYGFLGDSDYKIGNLKLTANDHNPYFMAQEFSVSRNGESLGNFKINLPGKHYVLDAVSALALCHELGLNLEMVREGLASYKGTVRRFEYIGEKDGTIFVDDYAHHPEEIKTTLKALREIFENKRITVIFHPHSFSRTEALISEFAQSFEDADNLFVLDIYGSREDTGNVSSSDLVKLINKYTPGKAVNIHTVETAIEDIRPQLRKNEVVVSMGAGDVWRVTHSLAKEE